jgi:hypothetical protein
MMHTQKRKNARAGGLVTGANALAPWMADGAPVEGALALVCAAAGRYSPGK